MPYKISVVLWPCILLASLNFGYFAIIHSDIHQNSWLLDLDTQIGHKIQVCDWDLLYIHSNSSICMYDCWLKLCSKYPKSFNWICVTQSQGQIYDWGLVFCFCKNNSECVKSFLCCLTDTIKPHDVWMRADFPRRTLLCQNHLFETNRICDGRLWTLMVRLETRDWRGIWHCRRSDCFCIYTYCLVRQDCVI